MKFTKEEISLCRQMVNKYRRQLKHGDWVVINFPRLKEAVTLFDTNWEEHSDESLDSPSVYNYSTDEYYKEYFPLWLIQDCLEFLRERGYVLEQHFEDDGFIHVALCDAGKEVKGRGDTDLEAFLKAVLMEVEAKEESKEGEK